MSFKGPFQRRLVYDMTAQVATFPHFVISCLPRLLAEAQLGATLPAQQSTATALQESCSYTTLSTEY